MQASVPVACGSPFQSGLIVDEKSTQIEPVNLSGDGQVSVKVLNTLDIELDIQAQPDVGESDQIWQKPPHADATNPSRIKPGDSATLKINVLPHRVEASKVSFFGVRPQEEHVSIPVRIDYSNPMIQNRVGHINHNVRIRFRPVFLYLVAALALGLAVGSVARLPKLFSFRDWLNESLRAAAVGVAAWVVGLFIVQFGSTLELFRFRLDPWQTIPTMLIGIVFGFLGDESVAAFKRLLNIPEAPKTSPPVAQGALK